ncbi:MAG: outer membrane protein [Rhodoplanes sp.]
MRFPERTRRDRRRGNLVLDEPRGQRRSGQSRRARRARAQLRSTIDSIATAGARVGLVADRALIYVKVAAAWADEEHTLLPSAVVLPQTIGDTRFGIVLGAGIEYMIAPILTAKLEYNYDDFGSQDYYFNTIPGQVSVDNRQRLHLLKLGLNYKFW